MLSIRAVPGLYRNSGWDVIRDEPDRSMTILLQGVSQQYAHDMAAILNVRGILAPEPPEDDRVARRFAEPEE